MNSERPFTEHVEITKSRIDDLTVPPGLESVGIRRMPVCLWIDGKPVRKVIEEH